MRTHLASAMLDGRGSSREWQPLCAGTGGQRPGSENLRARARSESALCHRFSQCGYRVLGAGGYETRAALGAYALTDSGTAVRRLPPFRGNPTQPLAAQSWTAAPDGAVSAVKGWRPAHDPRGAGCFGNP